ncbi:hypothetical protein SAMN04515674_10884 [Pseudarcicella hirudinis]|uniref:DUF937 domain-containing protein n=1 Tax=Pseudarcicella hirudinis TaxID=1079859 RepID=A0A1I5UW45_9BACT|nr:DUF937 domain-containing protein [Pseudarcicella hirudinis]SFP99440.1 hypothetical protein SAMN04515674_10884 [Pseudarcicella hirudinis]
MLEQLMGLIQDHSQDAIVNNPAIPNQHNDSAMQTILGAITGGLQQQAQGGQGGLSNVIGLLGGQGGQAGSGILSNPLVSGIAQNAIGGLMQKFGLDSSAASGIVSQVLPGVMNSLITKTNDPNDNSFDMGTIMNVLGDGKIDMNDVSTIAGKFMGGGQQGGLGGLLGGLFGGK